VIAKLQRRLETSQRDLEVALEDADYEALESLISAREIDIAELVTQVKAHPECKPWVKEFLERDRKLTVRLSSAMEQYKEKLEQAGALRQVHRAYLNEGSRR